MGLSESGLKSDIEDILESNNGDGPDSMEAFASDLTSAIISYLSDVEIDPCPQGATTSSPPVLDNTYVGTVDGTPDDPTPSDGESGLGEAILASCQASEGGNERIWDGAGAAYSALLATLVTWTNNEYDGAGTVVAGGIVDFDASWKVGVNDDDGEVSGTKSDVAADLADRIHTVTTDSVFSGTGEKSPYVTAWVSNLK